MQYIFIILKIVIIEYIIIFFHEFLHFIISLCLKFKCSFYHVIPFTIYKKYSNIKFKLKPPIHGAITSKSHFNCLKISSKIDYNILLNKIRFFFWIGPIYDFLIFIILFCIGVTYINYSYLALVSLIHLTITTINFFNSDGKYAIGSKEDDRIAFNLARDFTLCGNNKVYCESKRILTDIHMEVSENIQLEKFNVNDLWNFLNNISFYTNSLLSFLNKDILTLHSSTLDFFENLIEDFDDIKKYDYRQVEKTSISIIYYLIYKKLKDTDFSPDLEIINKVYTGCNSIYFRNLFDLYFRYKIQNKKYLINENNMPSSISLCEGYTKLLLNLVYLNNSSS